MTVFQIDMDRYGTASGQDSLTSGAISDCVVIAVHKVVGGVDQICMWHIGGGNIEESSPHHAAVKAFVAPRCTIQVGFGHMHEDVDLRRRWIERPAFESLLENSEIMPGPGDPPPNATVHSLFDLQTFTIAANGAVTTT